MRVLILNKKNIVAIIGAVLLLVISIVRVSDFLQKSEPANSSSKRLPIYSVETSEKKIALTFDIAWEDSDFEEILALLDTYEAKATLFVTGKWVENYPFHIQRAYKQGHDVQNHSYNHPHVASISIERLKADTTRCHDLIKKELQYDANLYRAPYGEYSDTMLAALEEMGYTTIQWDVDSRDWQPSATVESITKNVIENVSNGSIVLFHVDAKPKKTAESLKIILEELTKQNYSFVLMHDLLIKGDYEINHNGKMVEK